MTQFRHIVTSEDEGKEVRQITREYFDFSARLRNRIKREKLTMRNGAPTEGWHKVNEGDEISITLPDEHSNFPPEDIPLDIVFEDDDLMIINKQPGIVVHPTKGHPSGTCANGLANYMEKTGNVFKIRFVNRLDRDTSGLLIVAKNAYCQNHITNQMKQDLFVWNRDAMDEELVAQDIMRYTDGEVSLDVDNFRFAPVGMPSVQQLMGNGKKKKKK